MIFLKVIPNLWGEKQTVKQPCIRKQIYTMVRIYLSFYWSPPVYILLPFRTKKIKCIKLIVKIKNLLIWTNLFSIKSFTYCVGCTRKETRPRRPRIAFENRGDPFYPYLLICIIPEMRQTVKHPSISLFFNGDQTILCTMFFCFSFSLSIWLYIIGVIVHFFFNLRPGKDAILCILKRYLLGGKNIFAHAG